MGGSASRTASDRGGSGQPHRSHPKGCGYRSHRPRQRLRWDHTGAARTRGRFQVPVTHRRTVPARLQRRRDQENTRAKHSSRHAGRRESFQAFAIGTRSVDHVVPTIMTPVAHVFLALLALSLLTSPAGSMAQTIRIVALGDSTTAGTPAFKSPLESPPVGLGDETS